MSALDATIVSVAFPTMVSHFKTSLVLSGWILTVYTLFFIAAIPVASKLSDSGRRKQTLIICLLLFTVSSALCAFAPNIWLLTFFRAIQALGGGGFFSAAAGMISEQLPDRRQQMIGLLVSIANIGAVVGPNIGGLMVQYWGWESIFLVNVPIGIADMLLCYYLVNPDSLKKIKLELDYLGIGLIVGFVATIMVDATLLGSGFHAAVIAIVLIALLGMSLLVLFVLHCRRSPNAIINRELIFRRPFLAANFFNFIAGTCTLYGVLSLMPLFSTSVYGVSAIESGVMMTPISIGIIIGSVVTSFYIMKWGYRMPIVIGSLGICLGLALMAVEPGTVHLFGLQISPVIAIALIALLIGLSFGIVAPPMNNACIDLMPSQAASIAGIRQMAFRIGGIVSISVSTLIVQSNASAANGFRLVFGGFGLLLLLGITLAFFMPARPIPSSTTSQAPE
ncbi:MAG TPA: MFS transporter [Dehalococcoidales bacterium]|nr:MFS transporter [Dehalococcoidales bacterium]